MQLPTWCEPSALIPVLIYVRYERITVLLHALANQSIITQFFECWMFPRARRKYMPVMMGAV